MEQQKETQNEVMGKLLPVERPEQSVAELLGKTTESVFMDEMEKAAMGASRLQAAVIKLLAVHTYPEDWTRFGDKGCLGSAGVERLWISLPFKQDDWSSEKETFANADDIGYRYIYRARVSLWGRTVQAEGRYGTRDKFLAFKGGKWKPTTDINENYIQNAAYHICRAEGIKALLGIRSVPWRAVEQIITMQNRDPKAVTSVTHAQGSQGGLSDEDRELQSKITVLLNEMCGGNIEQMKSCLIEATTFHSDRDDKDVSCDSIKRLKGRWLKTAYGKVKIQHEEWDRMTSNEGT